MQRLAAGGPFPHDCGAGPTLTATGLLWLSSPGLRERQQGRRPAQSRRALAAKNRHTLVSQPGPRPQGSGLTGNPSCHPLTAPQRLLAHTFSSRGSHLGRGFQPPMWRRARGLLVCTRQPTGPAPLGVVFFG